MGFYYIFLYFLEKKSDEQISTKSLTLTSRRDAKTNYKSKSSPSKTKEKIGLAIETAAMKTPTQPLNQNEVQHIPVRAAKPKIKAESRNLI